MNNTNTTQQPQALEGIESDLLPIPPDISAIENELEMILNIDDSNIRSIADGDSSRADISRDVLVFSESEKSNITTQYEDKGIEELKKDKVLGFLFQDEDAPAC